MHVKRIHSMLESLTECAESAIKGDKTHVGKYPISDVIDMIKDLSEAEYHSKITHAMEKEDEEQKKEDEYALMRLKEEYGEEEGEKRFYNDRRYANGRYAPKGRGTRRGYAPVRYLISPENDYMSPEEWNRDMDRTREGKMYYPHDDSTRTMSESRYDRARRGYEESKMLHKGTSEADNQENLKSLEKMMNIIHGDVKELLPDMSPQEKVMLKNKMTSIAQGIN